MLTNRFAAFGATLFFMAHALVGQTINFANDDTLKAVFASGLHPWKYGGSLDRCEINDVQVTLLLPGGRKISDFPTDNGSFRSFADYTLSQASFYAGLLDVPDAAALAKRVATELGISTEGIDNLAAQANPTKPTSPSQWSGETRIGDLTIFIRFIPIPRFSEVKATVDFRLNWKRPFRRDNLVEKPLPPPPGYEDVGFGTPPPPKGPQVPNPGPEYYEALLRAKKGERPAPGITPSAASASAPSSSQPSASPTPTMTVKKPASSSFPIVPVVILAALIAGAAVFFLRRKSR